MELSLLDQWDAAKKSPRAAVLAAALGGLPPLGAYITAHYDVGRFTDWRRFALWSVLAACMVFSMRTVWGWGHAAFDERLKAVCLVVALEGLMVFSPTTWLAMLALCYLIGINAVATACNIAEKYAPKPQPTVSDVARELAVPRRQAARVVDRQLAAKPRPA